MASNGRSQPPGLSSNPAGRAVGPKPWGTRGTSSSGGSPACVLFCLLAWSAVGQPRTGLRSAWDPPPEDVGLESHLSGNERPWSPRRGHRLFSEPLGSSFRCSPSSWERGRPARAPACPWRARPGRSEWGVGTASRHLCSWDPLHSGMYFITNWFSFLGTKSGVREDGLESICPVGRGT